MNILKAAYIFKKISKRFNKFIYNIKIIPSENYIRLQPTNLQVYYDLYDNHQKPNVFEQIQKFK